MALPISIRCEDCKRQVTFIRQRTGEGVCQSCGHITNPKEVNRQREEHKKIQEGK